MRPMTTEELEVAIPIHEKRRKVFMEDGYTEDEAWELADILFDRDRVDSGDDRRICYECKHQDRKAKTCKINQAFYLPTILQRCDTFKLKGSK
jgi:hypothetical protein